MSRRSMLLGLTGAAGVLAMGACTGRPPPPAPGEPPYWPPERGAWSSVTPQDVGWDPVRLDEALTFAGSRATQALVVVLGGRILAERYWGVPEDFRRDIASCQKSVVSLLIGIARSRRLVGLDDPVSDRIGPGWSNVAADDEAEITIRHLLTMTSGLDDSLRRVAEPGTRWKYNNNAYYVLRLVLERVTATGIDQLCRSWLLGPIGAAESSWYQRPGRGDAKGRPISGLLMTARDMARLGLLVQRGGEWNGSMVVERAYLDEALRPSQDLRPFYGYLWWLNGEPPHPIGSAPRDLVAALGKGDQKIYVSKSEKLVVTRLGDAAGQGSDQGSLAFNEALWSQLMAAAP